MTTIGTEIVRMPTATPAAPKRKSARVLPRKRRSAAESLPVVTIRRLRHGGTIVIAIKDQNTKSLRRMEKYLETRAKVTVI